MLRFVLAAALAAVSAPAMGQDFKAPQITSIRPDWSAVALPAALAAPAGEADRDAQLKHLNAATGERFAAIAASAVPVLLPFDTEAYLRDRGQGKTEPVETYLAGFPAPSFFLAGAAGYDALFVLGGKDVAALADTPAREPVFVEISGSALLYQLPQPNGAVELPVREISQSFPGIRRLMIENHLRYAFERYGVPYVLSIYCAEGSRPGRRLSCKQADRIALHVLGKLQVAGGTPRAVKHVAPAPIERPGTLSADFTYHGPGRLLPGTGMKGQDGVVDYTVYGNIRFPFAQAPAYANSQSFMNWGDCDQTGRRLRGRKKGTPYHCRLSGKPLVFDESAPENYAYPWRDNFCEHRFFFVGQCAAGLGHQGQDIRPASCKLRNEGADRCEAYRDDVVAVHDGMIMRAPGQEAVSLIVNAENMRLRFRYMHMHPRRMDADKLLSGRAVRAGEVIGQAGNYNRRENGTTYHLHFETQVPTRDGWMRVNPYVTLVAAYERLIGGRGREIAEPEMGAEGPAHLNTAVTLTSGDPAQNRHETAK